MPYSPAFPTLIFPHHRLPARHAHRRAMGAIFTPTVLLCSPRVDELDVVPLVDAGAFTEGLKRKSYLLLVGARGGRGKVGIGRRPPRAPTSNALRHALGVGVLCVKRKNHLRGTPKIFMGGASKKGYQNLVCSFGECGARLIVPASRYVILNGIWRWSLSVRETSNENLLSEGL